MATKRELPTDVPEALAGEDLIKCAIKSSALAAMGKPTTEGKGKGKEMKGSKGKGKGKGKEMKGSGKGKGSKDRGERDRGDRERSSSERRERREPRGERQWRPEREPREPREEREPRPALAPTLTLDDKAYKAAIEEVATTTAIKPSDFDQKALALLEAFDKKGKVNEAIAHLKLMLKEIDRDHTSNWRAYIYTILKKFDAETYNEMKAEFKESGMRRPRGKREGNEERKEKKDQAREARFALTPFEFNTKAVEFVPAVPKGLNLNATEFVMPAKVGKDKKGSAKEN